MIPAEVITAPGDIELNAGRAALTIEVANAGDRKVYGFNARVMGALDGGTP